MSTTHSDKKSINWNKALKKRAVGSNNLELGEVHEVNDNYIIIQKGMLNKKTLYIPISKFESFDGHILKVQINEEEMDYYQHIDENNMDNKIPYKSTNIFKEKEEFIPIIQEDIEITKKIVEDYVNIVKIPIKEKRTVQVELMHEEVFIERISFSEDDLNHKMKSEASSNDQSFAAHPIESNVEIFIPIKREEPVIIKQPYVIEEIIIKKKPITTIEKVTEETMNGEIRYIDKETNKS